MGNVRDASVRVLPKQGAAVNKKGRKGSNSCRPAGGKKVRSLVLKVVSW